MEGVDLDRSHFCFIRRREQGSNRRQSTCHRLPARNARDAVAASLS